jgi:hypothetical protein
MNQTHTKHITIGRNPGLTYAILNALAEKRARKEDAARRREKLSQFCRNALDALRFWK